MKLDFNKPARDQRGEIITDNKKPVMMNEILSNALAMATGKIPVVKFFEWSERLAAAEIIDLDTADQKLLQQWIEGHEAFTAVAKKRLLDVFEHAAKKK